ncbi:MAG: 50S ribosomal protein L11 methyltransferase [Ferruginibacter sp.]
MNYIVIIVPTTTELEQERLIACLMDYPVRAFQQEPDRLLIFPEQDDPLEQSVLQYLTEKQIDFHTEQIEAENWNANWEQQLEPVLVSTNHPQYKQISVRATFQSVHPMADLEVVITPRMSFGTGHHATTRLMIEQLASLPVMGKRVLDVGTGTGVLAILAHKMGASAVYATESDHWVYNNALDNFSENNFEDVVLIQTEQIPRTFPDADIILANINTNTILGLLPQLKDKANIKEAWVVLSGWLLADRDILIKAVLPMGFTLATVAENNGWGVMTCHFASD